MVIQGTQMKVSERGRQGSGEYHCPEIVGSSSLLAIKESSSSSMFPLKFWLPEESHTEYSASQDPRTQQHFEQWSWLVSSFTIIWGKSKFYTDVGKKRRKNCPHTLGFPRSHKLQGRKWDAGPACRYPGGTQPMNQMLGYYLLKAGSKYISLSL